MVVEILFVMAMFLWFLTVLPFPQTQPYAPAAGLLCFVAVLLLGIFVFVPGLR